MNQSDELVKEVPPVIAVPADQMVQAERHQHTAVTLRRLVDLMLGEDNYDIPFCKPSRAAFDLTWIVISEAQPLLPGDVPRASPAAVGDGGIFVQWGGDPKYVRLLVPADPASAYLYYHSGTAQRTFRQVSPGTLTALLVQLAQE